ncbi:MAG: hypothetical protein H7Y10_03410 [Flavobacterium sp.]|nr:hypothetical protein [Flavobacterium sp.]
MENGLTKEENIILNMLLAKRDKNNIVKPVDEKISKQRIKEIKDEVRKKLDSLKYKDFKD